MLLSIISQDIEAFSDDTFDSVEWINKTYANGTDKNVNKEIFVSNLVSKMQLYVQQLVYFVIIYVLQLEYKIFNCRILR